MIRNAEVKDAEQLAHLYNWYVQNSICTFELDAIAPEVMAQRIEAVTTCYPWLVFESNGEILGYSYASKWKERKAYAHTVETSVYVKNGHGGNGIGQKVYQALLDQLKELDVHAVIAGIVLPNAVSVRLHEKLGFSKIGQFKEVGNKFGKWHDVGYWELILKDKQKGDIHEY